MNNYNNITLQNIFVTYNDYISSKNEEIHKLLYEDSLDKFFEENPSYTRGNCNIKEMPSLSYWLPSKIILRENNGKSEIIDLTNYWNNDYVIDMIIKNSNSVEYIDEESKPDLKIKYIDYVRNQVVVFSRYTGKEYIIPIHKTNDLSVDSDYTLENTFYNKHISK